MTPFEENLLNDLKEINTILKTCTDNNLIESLNRDKKDILHYLGYITPNCQKENSNDFINNDVTDFIITNQMSFIALRSISSFKTFHFNKNKNGIDNLKLFNSFLNDIDIDLKYVYEQIKGYDGIFYSNLKNFYLGYTIYFESLRKNYIEIHYENQIKDYQVLTHELGHAKQNLMKPNSKNIYPSVFCEAYPTSIELIFSEYIKKYGLYKESFNFKYSMLVNVINISNILYNDLNIYLNENNSMNRTNFNYRYKLLMSHLLAFHFYNVYLINPAECLELLNNFNNNFCATNDCELLESINLNFEDLKHLKILSEFLNNLKEEKLKIKSKIKLPAI